ncbi:hypothetical protein ACFYS8_13535 [Kitasatospora sp. NPDC004615]|uniref:hypothetical protein n=1 Tax=unclassified Kitasatospora TaxID=2633591 RepID=UPI0036A36E4D
MLRWREGRFEPRQMPANQRGVVLWAVWDTDANDWVRDDGKPLVRWSRDGAADWISWQRDITERPSASWWRR